MTDIQLSKHFKLSEFTKSGTATKYGIDNTPPLNVISNLQYLCKEILEPLREWVNEPIVISSGYRCPQLNSHPEVRGATKSQHLTGEAADIRIPWIQSSNGSNSSSSSKVQDLEKGRRYLDFILDNVRFDHLIWEHDRYGHYWIHVSFKRDDSKNRQLYTPNLLKK